MNCPFCKGSAKLEKADLILDNGKIIIKNEPNYKCKKCKQEFCTSDQMFHLDKKIAVLK
ncbi:MAG: YgiT-type zinc finger protein [Candidatus ainarchaeum sp.]|nr:YgiT-type zinc finger protein [Candidatus ainarchaeum sp.]